MTAPRIAAYFTLRVVEKFSPPLTVQSGLTSKVHSPPATSCYAKSELVVRALH